MKITRVTDSAEKSSFCISETSQISAKILMSEMLLSSNALERIFECSSVKKLNSLLEQLLKNGDINYNDFFEYDNILSEIIDIFLKFIIDTPKIKVNIV